jgi:hypothetical protein
MYQEEVTTAARVIISPNRSAVVGDRVRAGVNRTSARV